jgi:hypothetical protein
MTDIHQHLHGGARNLPADRHACGKYLKYAILKAARNDTKCDRPVRQCQFGGLQLLLRRRQPRHRFLPVSPPGVPAGGDTNPTRPRPDCLKTAPQLNPRFNCAQRSNQKPQPPLTYTQVLRMIGV